jgi:glyoxylase-like metal-dependent hydrolase (beta-lactamase superfamily II)
MEWSVIETPGHTPGSICLLCLAQNGNHPGGLSVLVSGDTLFAGTTGRTDFEGGSDADMAESMKKLAKLPDDIAVLPGHNSLATIGNSRRVFARFGA